MNKKLNFINEYRIQDLIKNDISKIKNVKLKDIYGVLGVESSNPIGESESLGEPIFPFDHPDYSKFKSIKGSPLSKHPVFKEMSWLELVEYAKQNEKNKKEVSQLFRQEYVWWMNNVGDQMRLPGGFLIPRDALDNAMKKLSKQQKEFDVESFHEFATRHSFSTLIRVIGALALIWSMWWTINYGL